MTPHFELRPAILDDFQFCWSLYRDSMKPLTLELMQWNEAGQRRAIEQSLAEPDTLIIVANALEVGWVHFKETEAEIYLGQLYVTPAMQNRGIGGAITQQMIDTARKSGKSLRLDVMKNNRARSLYERLGFRVITSSQYKYTMQWFPDA